MQKTQLMMACSLSVGIVFGCQNNISPTDSPSPTYAITYYGNGNSGGTVPIDATAYRSGSTITIKDNTGNLQRIGKSFAVWNTKQGGTGTSHPAGSTMSMGAADVALYAQWLANGSVSVVLPQPPSAATLIVSGSASIRLAYGLGPSLPYNTWMPWGNSSFVALWYPFVAEAGKTYSIYWDDANQGSACYTGDIMVGAYLKDKTTRVLGWASDINQGYQSASILSVTSTQIVYLKVLPYGSIAASIGTFALRVVEAGSMNGGESFAWYLDGVPIDGAVGYAYDFDPSGLVAGRYRLTVIGARDGAMFSDTYTFDK